MTEFRCANAIGCALLLLLLQKAAHSIYASADELSCYNEDIADYLESHLATKTPYRKIQNSNTDNMTEYKGMRRVYLTKESLSQHFI